jgi:hypothetical protein
MLKGRKGDFVWINTLFLLSALGCRITIPYPQDDEFNYNEYTTLGKKSQ